MQTIIFHCINLIINFNFCLITDENEIYNNPNLQQNELEIPDGKIFLKKIEIFISLF